MIFLRTNTATRITVGPFLDKTDGITPETALTVTNCKLTMTVDTGGVPTLVLDTNPTASGGNNDMVHITGDDAGMYDLELTAANTNYLGRAKVVLTDAANHCPVWENITILPAMIYDSMILGTDRLDANVTHVNDTAQTAGDFGADLDSLLASATIIMGLTSTQYTLTGTAAGAAAASLTLSAAASSVNDFYNYQLLSITAGTGAGQARFITDYDGTTKVAMVGLNWYTTPDAFSSFAIQPLDQVAGSAPTATQNAEELLRYDMSTLTGEASRSPANAWRLLRNKWDVASGTLTVKKENDTTTAWTAAITSDAAADPIIGSDPS